MSLITFNNIGKSGAEAKMSKGKSITLLSIVSALMAIILVMSFLRFPIGVKDYNSALGAISQDYDIAGGIAYTLTLNEDNENDVDDVDKVVEILKQRLEELGHTAYLVKPIKSTDKDVLDHQIRIEIVNSSGAQSDVAAVAAYGEVKFYGGESENPTTQVLEDVKVIKDSQYLGEGTDGHVISLEFTEEGALALQSAIGEASAYYLKITCGLDANGDEIALFNGSFNKSLLDNGNRMLSLTSATEESAKQMALQIRSGGLAYRYDISEGIIVQSPYGEDVALKCTIAIITLILVSIIILLIAYRGLGIISALSIILFILFETWLLIGVPNIIVNLGSIVGIVSATLVCLFTMVMLMQKIKDEFANSEKTAKAAINKGFKDSLVPSINIHVTCGIVAILLLIFTKGIVKSFAITFGIGMAVSLISTLVFTRMFNALILPLVKDKEKFLRFKRAEKIGEEE